MISVTALLFALSSFQGICKKEGKKEYVLSKQILRNGTAIGALVRKATYAQSKADFISKMSIALKEAHETEYWLCLLKDTEYLGSKLFKSLCSNYKELIRLLIATIKTSKGI